VHVIVQNLAVSPTKRKSLSTRPEDRLRRLIADPSVSLEGMLSEFERERPTAQSTVEAIMFAVRERGVDALTNHAPTAERLERCDGAACAQINKRIAKIVSNRGQG
jgi:hypothetical protein